MKNNPSKSQKILKSLSRPSGVTISQLQKITGWQPHSVRALLSGLRKQGIVVTRTTNSKGTSKYCVAGDAI